MRTAALSPVTARHLTAGLIAGAESQRRYALHLLTQAGIAVMAGADGDPAGTDLAIVFAAAGAGATQALADDLGGLDGLPTVVVMPAQSSGTMLRRVLRAGVAGIVFEDRLDEALVATARAVAAGQLAMPPELRRHLAPRALTHREKEILGLVVLGYTNRQIADRLFVAESTVKTHLSSAFEKLDARSRAEAAALILDPEEGLGRSILALSQTEDHRLG
jgi:DNA-binding NarL/FixJ family response regulator